MAKIQFSWLSGDKNFLDYGGKWISQPLTNGEFTYFYVVDLLNWEDTCGRDAPAEKYHVTLSVVVPSEAPARAFDDWTREQWDEFASAGYVWLVLAEACHSYGTAAPVWQQSGNNWRKLFSEARKQAQESEFVFGFAMDRPINAMGTSGWQWVRGEL